MCLSVNIYLYIKILSVDHFASVGEELYSEGRYAVATAQVEGLDGGQPLSESVNRSAAQLAAPGQIDAPQLWTPSAKLLQKFILHVLAPRHIQRLQVLVTQTN